ncbi:hypothetical protein [Spirochaeta lutea]|uniref:hypothetical protein n=1 Tax=Spirochaeta lutea TaxID=1480694 RepID=UPI00068BB03A|nr:hypothetical protein [Spirochaeta lutea]
MSTEQQDIHKPMRLFIAGLLIILGVVSPVLVLSQEDGSPVELEGPEIENPALAQSGSEDGGATQPGEQSIGPIHPEQSEQSLPGEEGVGIEDRSEGYEPGGDRGQPGTAQDAGALESPGTEEYKTFTSIFDDSMVLGFYGNPHSSFMGILGEQSIERTAQRLREVAQEYQALAPDIRVRPAFHLIYATVWADANVGRLAPSIIQRYVDYAAEHDMLVILDHQLGKFSVEESVKEMLPWLRYEQVHLAIDPEWSTLVPGKEIGWVSAQEVNEAQQMIQDYLIQEEIPGRKFLIVHQFNRKMITQRELVRSDFERVDLVHNADGFGPPPLKMYSWNYIVEAENMPLKGFKLFYPKDWKDKGYDDPLMSPQEVMSLDPRPVYINYQ